MYLIEKGYSVIGVDISEKMLEIAKKNNYNYSKEFWNFRKNLSEQEIIYFRRYYWE